MHRESTLGIDNSFPKFFFLKNQTFSPYIQKKKNYLSNKIYKSFKKIETNTFRAQNPTKTQFKTRKKRKKITSKFKALSLITKTEKRYLNNL